MKISVLLPTYNSEKSLKDTLESIKWADEILVVDSFSDDLTIEIAKSYNAKIIQHKYINSAKQKNWAIQHCKYDWILQIDSDEILESGAFEEIMSVLNDLDDDIHCFRLRRKNFVLGKWIRNGGIYPDWEYRLFRKSFAKWLDKEVHSRLTVNGEIGTLKSHLLHFGMPNISKQVKNLDRYTRYEADELVKRGKKFSIIRWIVFPFLIFIRRYFFQMGFIDGWRGLFLAIYGSFYYFLMYSKLKEIKHLSLKESPK